MVLSALNQLGWHLCRTKLHRNVLNSKTKCKTKSGMKSSKNAPKHPRNLKALFRRLKLLRRHLFTGFQIQFQTQFQPQLRTIFSQRESAGMAPLNSVKLHLPMFALLWTSEQVHVRVGCPTKALCKIQHVRHQHLSSAIAWRIWQWKIDICVIPALSSMWESSMYIPWEIRPFRGQIPWKRLHGLAYQNHPLPGCCHKERRNCVLLLRLGYIHSERDRGSAGAGGRTA